MTFDELVCEFKKFEIKKYRADQVFSWLSKGVGAFNEMANLPLEMRESFESKYKIISAKIFKRFVSADGTVKFLITLPDGNKIESVLMKYKYGYSVCLSTQIGCKMGCKFCASSSTKFIRNLSPSEIIAQLEIISKSENEKVSNITLMGVGEPFDNYENVIKFIKIVIAQNGMAIGARRISISTCGIINGIKKFADEKLGATLSVSLHASDDHTRNAIMPINRKFNLYKLIDSCRYYMHMTNRRISFEYILLDNINDSENDAKQLANLILGLSAHVNLIPANNIEGSYYFASPIKRIELFARTLIKFGVNVTVRRTLGNDINASCGQLRRIAVQ
jgi:23S rRNA (adenine2503-C2)-methyltransferase